MPTAAAEEVLAVRLDVHVGWPSSHRGIPCRADAWPDEPSHSENIPRELHKKITLTKVNFEQIPKSRKLLESSKLRIFQLEGSEIHVLYLYRI